MLTVQIASTKTVVLFLVYIYLFTSNCMQQVFTGLFDAGFCDHKSHMFRYIVLIFLLCHAINCKKVTEIVQRSFHMIR